MLRLTGSFLVLAMTAGAAAAEPMGCEKLMDEYVQVNKELSAIWADGIVDDSAPRATNRELKALNGRMIQSMSIDMMIAKNCPLPDQPSSFVIYLSPALACSTEGYKGTKESIAAKCDRATWQPRTTNNEEDK
eukprot:GHVR01040063.1.p1 GENE.GHVR01040063.1~~GHVR01040063.1.p1  ORF type:complete len:133 (-),score=10.37 GHVR01040063.1:55-453(-)